MRLVCIECGTAIPAANINVNKLIAVCPACNSVFHFELHENKVKQRKIKAPERMVVHDDAPLHLSYDRVFGSENRAALIGIGFATFMFTVIMMTTIGGFLADDMSIFVPLFVGTLWFSFFYTELMLYFTKTRIISDGNQLRAEHEFFPHPLQEKDRSIDIHAIQRVFMEESYSSKRRVDAERSYHLYAETDADSRALILKGVPEKYALFIQQEIMKLVHEEADYDGTRLLLAEEENDEISDYIEMRHVKEIKK